MLQVKSDCPIDAPKWKCRETILTEPNFLLFSEEGGYVAFMMDWASCTAVERDPEKVSGSWVFRGTRVPVVALFENLEGGASIDDFLSWFPGVKREQVEAVLEHNIRSLQTDRQAA